MRDEPIITVKRALPVLALVTFAFLCNAAGAQGVSFAVTNTNDSGPGSLRDAISQSNATGGQNTISMPEGHYTIGGSGDDTNVTGDYDITSTVTINGAGPGKTVIDGANADRLFDVKGANTGLALSGLDCINGNNGSGACVLTVGSGLTLANVRINGNRSGNPGTGFGVIEMLTTVNATLVISASQLNDNRVGGSGTAGHGTVDANSTAGITATVTDSQLNGNSVGGGGAAGFGGALNVVGINASLSIANSTLNGNSVGGGGGAGFGGAVLMEGDSSAGFVAQNSNFSGNSAGGGGAAGFGGGVMVGSTNGSVGASIMDGHLDDNRAGGLGGAGAGFGGGVELDADTALNATIERSSLERNIVGSPATGFGGGIDADGTPANLTVRDSSLSENTAGSSGGAGAGGGISFSSGSQGLLTLERSAVANNIAGGGGAGAFGGGIEVSGNDGNLTLVNSTIHGNVAGGGAGGDGHGGGIDFDPTVAGKTAAITNSTITDNTAAGASTGGGIRIGVVHGGSLRNTVVAGNSAATGTNCTGTTSSLGHNLEGADSCAFNAAGDLKNTDPLLGGLAGNGGSTKTRSLQKGSPAINAADGNGCPATDQRGGSRPQPPGGSCDIGAYEYGSLADLTLTSKASPDPADAGRALTYKLTATNAGPSPDDAGGIRLSDVLPGGASLSSVKTSQGSCSGKGTVNCSLGTLAKGTSAQVTIVAKPPHAGTATNTPTLSGDPTEVDPASNVAKTSTKVLVGISGLRLRPRTFRAAGSGASIARRAGARISYRLSDRSTVSFRVQKLRRGRKSKSGKCGARSKQNRGGKRCTYYRNLKGSFRKKSKAGRNRIRFRGRLRRHKLRPGRYRLVATAKGKNGNSRAATARFRIKRR